MKKNKTIKIIIILLILIIVINNSVKNIHKEINNNEDLITVYCDGGHLYDVEIDKVIINPIKKDGIAECTIDLQSPLFSSLTYNKISFDYIIEGEHEIIEYPTNTSIEFSDKSVYIYYSEERTLNDKRKYDHEYTPLFSFKIHIKNNNNSDKLVFRLSNIKITNKKHQYILNNYTKIFDIEKDS